MRNGNNKGSVRLLTVSQVAERLQLSVALIYSMVSEGTLPALRIGNGRGSIRFREQDVGEYLDDCAVIGKKLPHRPTRMAPKPRHEFKHLKVGKGVQK